MLFVSSMIMINAIFYIFSAEYCRSWFSNYLEKYILFLMLFFLWLLIINIQGAIPLAMGIRFSTIFQNVVYYAGLSVLIFLLMLIEVTLVYTLFVKHSTGTWIVAYLACSKHFLYIIKKNNFAHNTTILFSDFFCSFCYFTIVLKSGVMTIDRESY